MHVLFSPLIWLGRVASQTVLILVETMDEYAVDSGKTLAPF
jgi:hypothetical protein